MNLLPALHSFASLSPIPEFLDRFLLLFCLPVLKLEENHFISGAEIKRRIGEASTIPCHFSVDILDYPVMEELEQTQAITGTSAPEFSYSKYIF